MRTLSLVVVMILGAALMAAAQTTALAPSLQILAPLAFRGWGVSLIAVSYFAHAMTSVVYNVAQVSFRQTICPYRLQGRMNATMQVGADVLGLGRGNFLFHARQHDTNRRPMRLDLKIFSSSRLGGSHCQRLQQVHCANAAQAAGSVWLRAHCTGDC